MIIILTEMIFNDEELTLEAYSVTLIQLCPLKIDNNELKTVQLFKLRYRFLLRTKSKHKKVSWELVTFAYSIFAKLVLLSKV